MSAPTPDPGRAAIEAEKSIDRRCTRPGDTGSGAPACDAPAWFAVRLRVGADPATRVTWTPCREHVAAVVDRPHTIVAEINTVGAAVITATYELVAARRGTIGRRAQLAARAAGDLGDLLMLHDRYIEQMERLAHVDVGAVTMPDDPAATVPGERTSDR